MDRCWKGWFSLGVDEEFMKNWLEIAVGLYLLGMVLYGHYRGAIRMAVCMAALAATFLIVHMAMPSVTAFIKNQTPVYGWMRENVEGALTPEESQSSSLDGMTAIENLNLPQEILDSLYETFGVNVLIESVSDYVAGWMIHVTGFVVLFLAVYVVIHVMMRWLDVMARLPIVSGVNKIAGAILGGVQGLLFVWLILLLIHAFSRSSWAEMLLVRIEGSRWLSFLYHYNVLSRLVFGIS